MLAGTYCDMITWSAARQQLGKDIKNTWPIARQWQQSKTMLEKDYAKVM
jgi:hypothetical protein